MLWEPVSIHAALLLRHTSDHDRRRRGPKGIVVDRDRRARNLRAVLAIATAVHVEAVAQRRAQFDIVPRFVAAARAPRTCNRVPVEVEQIPLDQWSPSQGLGTLVEKLALPGDTYIPDKDSETRLRSLLSATKFASSINNVDITFGIITGTIVGALIGLLTGFILFQSGIIKTEADQVSFALAFLAAGLLSGALIGAIAYAFLQRGRVAFRKISAACGNYNLDPGQLAKLSQGYGRVVRQAIRAVQEKPGGTRLDP